MTMSALILVATSALLIAALPCAVWRASRTLGEGRACAARRSVLATLIAGTWAALSAVLAAGGQLAFGPVSASTPPPFMVLVTIGLIGTAVLAWSPIGTVLARGLAWHWLVGFQCFRILAELALHHAWVEGRAPVQMTFHGLNYDILTGLSAVPVALLLWRRPSRRLALIWNACGLLLLATIVTIAILSTPTPLRVFHNEPANTWVTGFPSIWLPTVLVPFALAGHLLLWRALRPSR